MAIIILQGDSESDIRKIEELGKKLNLHIHKLTDADIEKLNLSNENNVDAEWEKLSPSQQAGIIAAIEQLERTPGVVHEEVIKKYRGKYEH